MFLSSKLDFWRIFKVDSHSKKLQCLKFLAIIGVAGYVVPIIFEKKIDQKTKILAVAELKNINSASSNEHLKMGGKRETGVIL